MTKKFTFLLFITSLFALSACDDGIRYKRSLNSYPDDYTNVEKGPIICYGSQLSPDEKEAAIKADCQAKGDSCIKQEHSPKDDFFLCHPAAPSKFKDATYILAIVQFGETTPLTCTSPPPKGRKRLKQSLTLKKIIKKEGPTTVSVDQTLAVFNAADISMSLHKEGGLAIVRLIQPKDDKNWFLSAAFPTNQDGDIPTIIYTKNAPPFASADSRILYNLSAFPRKAQELAAFDASTECVEEMSMHTDEAFDAIVESTFEQYKDNGCL